MVISSYTHVSTAFSTISLTIHNVGNKVVSKICNRPTIGNILRVYNAVIAAAVFTDYMTNRRASPNEYLFDIVVHGLQASVSDHSPDLLKRVTECMNLLRVSSISYYHFTGTSTIPNGANAADLLNHGFNVAYLFTSPQTNS